MKKTIIITGADGGMGTEISREAARKGYQIDDDKETMKTIAAGGFKDITRIASSRPAVPQTNALYPLEYNSFSAYLINVLKKGCH